MGDTENTTHHSERDNGGFNDRPDNFRRRRRVFMRPNYGLIQVFSLFGNRGPSGFNISLTQAERLVRYFKSGDMERWIEKNRDELYSYDKHGKYDKNNFPAAKSRKEQTETMNSDMPSNDACCEEGGCCDRKD